MRNVLKQWESDRETVRKRRKNLQLLDNRFSTASLLFSGSPAIASQLLSDCFATVCQLFSNRFTMLHDCSTIASPYNRRFYEKN